jgi:hypothetical protein
MINASDLKNLSMTRFLSMSFFKTYAAWLLMPFLGMFFGVLASTANPLVIGMGASSFIGIILLSKPAWHIELVIILGLFIGGLVMLFFGSLAVKMVWGISILGFMLLVAALYRVVVTPQVMKGTPIFVWLALLFFFYAIIDSLLLINSARETIGGFKRYFQMWGLLFGLCWLGFDEKNINRWCMLVLGICLLQAPFCLYENIFLIPIREGYVASNPNLVPVDIVAGTFGADMLGGGNNAEMATVLIMVFAFLLARFKEKLMSGKKLFWVSFILLSPLVMGETKIVVILFPLMFFTLYRKEMFTRPHYAVMALIFGSLFTVLTLNVYMVITKMSLDELVFDTLKYNVYEVGYGDCYLNRTTVLTFWGQRQGLSDPISFLFGNGLGSTREGDDILTNGHIGTRYQGHCVGLTGVSTLLWELGVFGIGLFLMIIVTAWRCANQLIKLSGNKKIRADASAIQAALAIFAVYPLYRDTILSEFSFQLIFACLLGYLAWMYKYYAEHKS